MAADQHQFLLDRNFGSKALPRRLLKSGIEVLIHDTYFNPDETDENIIKTAAAHGWVLITKDKRIRFRETAKDLIRSRNARMIVVTTKDQTTDVVSQVLIDAMPKICRFLDSTPPPFVAKLTKNGIVEVYPEWA